MHTFLSESIAKMRIEELRREAESYRRARLAGGRAYSGEQVPPPRPLKKRTTSDPGGSPCAEC